MGRTWPACGPGRPCCRCTRAGPGARSGAAGAAGLSLAWYDVLLELNAAPDRQLSMSELGARAVLSRTRVSRVVDELERAGLVRAPGHPSDRRSTYAALTSLGRRRFRTAAPVYLRGIAEHFATHLNRPELETIADALERVRDAQN